MPVERRRQPLPPLRIHSSCRSGNSAASSRTLNWISPLGYWNCSPHSRKERKQENQEDRLKPNISPTLLNLQNPSNKREIFCDAKLKKLFNGKGKVGFLDIAKLLSPHFVKSWLNGFCLEMFVFFVSWWLLGCLLSWLIFGMCLVIFCSKNSWLSR